MSVIKFPTEGLRSFFESLETGSAAADVTALAAMYAPSLMTAGPHGTHVVSSADMLQVIPRRQQLFASAGHRRTSLVRFAEQPLTDRYSLVSTEWQWEFARPDDGVETVTLPSTYLVDRGGDSPQIFVYLMHHDITAVLRERGLIVEAAAAPPRTS